MQEPSINPERIAALIDGRLNEQERAELLAMLAASGDAFEDFADAAAAVRELNAAEDAQVDARVATTEQEPITDRAAGGVEHDKSERDTGSNQASPQPAQSARTRSAPVADAAGTGRAQRARRSLWLHPRGGWLAIAAAVIAIALLPWMWSTFRTRRVEDPDRFVAILTEPSGLPAGWNDHPWGAVRAATASVAPQARAVRLGARLTDLELAVRARDTAATAIALDVVTLLGDLQAQGPTVSIYEAISREAGGPPERLAPLLEEGRIAVARAVGEELVAAGAWTEAARIAAARHDGAFFRAWASRTMLDRVDSLFGARPPVRALLERIRVEMAPSGSPSWDALREALTELLRNLGG